MNSIFILIRNVHTNASNMCPCSSYVGRTLSPIPSFMLFSFFFHSLCPFLPFYSFFSFVFSYIRQLIHLLLFYYSIIFFYYSPPFSLPICFIVSLDVRHSYFHPFSTSFIFLLLSNLHFPSCHLLCVFYYLCSFTSFPVNVSSFCHLILFFFSLFYLSFCF